MRFVLVLLGLWGGSIDAAEVRIKIWQGAASALTLGENRLAVSATAVKVDEGAVPLRNGQATVRPKAALRLDGKRYQGKFHVDRDGATVRIVQALELEDYLPGVLAQEIFPNWPPAALEAQAVAARSFAWVAREQNARSPWHLEAGTSHQAYAGNVDVPESCRKAVAATRDLAVLHRGKVVVAFFHSCCGGETERALDVWPASTAADYLQNVPCAYCADSPSYRWRTNLALDEVRSTFTRQVGEGRLVGLRLAATTRTGRIRSVEILSAKGLITNIDGSTFRLAIGASRLPSLLATMVQREGTLAFEGRGWGHGIGLCQWGARGMAKAGYGFREILGHYYRAIEIGALRTDARSERNDLGVSPGETQ